MTDNKKSYLEVFQTFRFIAISSIVIYHTARNTDFFQYIPIIIKDGSLWNYFFFILSGFILSYTYEDKEIKIREFYLKRVFKIYPMYFVSLLLIFFMH